MVFGKGAGIPSSVLRNGLVAGFGSVNRRWACRTLSTNTDLKLPVGHVGEIYYDGGYPFEYLNDYAKTAQPAIRKAGSRWATSVT